jgi:peptide chain release factor 2
MRERQHLDDIDHGLKRLESTSSPTISSSSRWARRRAMRISSPRPRRRSRSSEPNHKQQIEALLSGEADSNDTFLEVHSGAGGTESQDWASTCFCACTPAGPRSTAYKVELLEIHDGEEAGIKSATLLVKGHNAYGWLKTESGVHRLVRISPYDSNARRHTSFARVSGSIR